MGKLIGIIPWRVISIMDLLELSGSDALAEVKDWGTAINATIQAEGQAIYDEEANSISSTGSYTTVEEHELENLDNTHDRDEDDDDQDDADQADADQADADQADADQADDDQDNDDDQNIEAVEYLVLVPCWHPDDWISQRVRYAKPSAC
ncbi:hypothetical protein quinque_000088 [Culex quinquefasciatus]